MEDEPELARLTPPQKKFFRKELNAYTPKMKALLDVFMHLTRLVVEDYMFCENEDLKVKNLFGTPSTSTTITTLAGAQDQVY